MFNKLKISMAGTMVMSLLHTLATDKNTQTTVMGMLAGAILAIQGLDMSRLISGDPHQIALVVSSLAVAGVGFLATKENHDGHTTMLGVVAGASQMYIGNITSAVVLAMCGYLTNKKPAAAAPAALKEG